MKKINQGQRPLGQPTRTAYHTGTDPRTSQIPLAALPHAFQELIDAARRSPNRSLIKLDRTAEKSAIARSTVWRDVKRGVFVPPVRISSRSVAWVEVEIDAFLAAKALISRSGATLDLAEFVTALVATSPSNDCDIKDIHYTNLFSPPS